MNSLYDDKPPISAADDFAYNSFGRLVFVYNEDGKTKKRSQDYADLQDVDYDDYIGIILLFRRWQVTLEGKNLDMIREGIDMKEIGRITERHKDEAKTKDTEPYISRIIWERVKEGM